MPKTLAIMITMTTYGTWLRGDMRGWVERGGRVLPPDPPLEAADRARRKHPVFLFDASRLLEIGAAIGHSLRDRLHLRILALAVRTWHVHTVIAATEHRLPKIVKCAKDAARWELRPGRRIWTAGYDKRFCFDEESVRRRIAYVERHNTELGLPAKPWDFIEDYPFGGE
jgi:hypothetical protein